MILKIGPKLNFVTLADDPYQAIFLKWVIGQTIINVQYTPNLNFDKRFYYPVFLEKSTLNFFVINIFEIQFAVAKPNVICNCFTFYRVF